MSGGLADKKQPADFDKKKLKQGQKVEMEHTSDPAVAKEIAMDHLSEDPEYYKKLAEMEKQDKMRIVAVDGKSQIVEGKEPLEKEPEISKKWKRVKKSLNNLESIMDLKEQAQFSDDEKEEKEPVVPESVEPESSAGDEMPEPAPAPSDGAPDAEVDAPIDEQAEIEQLIESLKHHGYSDAEIAHIVHDHHFPEIDANSAHKMQLDQQDAQLDNDIKEKQSAHELEHKKRMSDLEYETAKAGAEDPSVVKQHKVRMLELEYEIERERKILELQFKKKELELKLKHMEQSHAQKLNPIKEDSKA